MDLDFERGDSRRPRGHALIYFRDTSQADRLVATYVVILPISIDLAKYIPPLLAPHVGSLQDQEASAFALPPIPDQVVDYGVLRKLADRRDDDLINGGALYSVDMHGMMMRVHEKVQAYAQLYADAEADEGIPDEKPTLEVQEVIYELLGTQGRLEELAKLLGKLRFALDGSDLRLLDGTLKEAQNLARLFPGHYRMDTLLDFAKTPGTRSGLLAQLYLERCYKLVREDLPGLQDLEARIKEQEDGEYSPGGA